MPARTVFISYSHKDKDLLGPLVAQLKALEQAGVLDVWVDTRIDAGEKWYPDIEQAMQRAAVAVCLVSEYFLASDFCTKEEIPFLLRRAEQDGLLIIPVLLSDCVWDAHRWVEERQMLPGEGQSVRTHYPTNPAAVFSRVAKRIHDKFNDPGYRPPTAPIASVPLPPEKIDITHLPETGAALFGRDDELTLLDKIWAGEAPSVEGAPTRVLAFKAQGGVGKSTLINHWLAEMRHDHFRGATRVFGWSFYSQGVREQGAPSADAFVAAALRFFGDETMAASATSPWDKGQRLARLVGAERALLVLDGMEPLQSAHQVDRGKLRDPALEALLRGLAKQSAGLCIITTREPLADLGKKSGIVECDLEQITPQAGRALLRAVHVAGTDAELESLAARFGPHALAISLLGVYLHEQPGRRIGPATALEQMPGKTPVDRVLAGFEKWLGPSAELEALRLLGFFDRPADEGSLQALRATPAIPGLTELLAGMADADWFRVLAHLDKLRLIHARHGDTGKRFVDTHPIIREHFAEQLREKSPDAWREGHCRLYGYLCATTQEGDEPTLEDLQPLYQAVAHGCQAGLARQAHDDVLIARIWQGTESDGFYSTKKLGAYGNDLGAIACFFETAWRHVRAEFPELTQSSLISVAAFRLRALGRLTESLESTRAALQIAVKHNQWKSAAVRAGNLSEVELTLGDVAGATADAEESVVYADRSGDAFQRILTRTTHADSLHQAGRRAEADRHFGEAEQMQKETQPGYPLLYSLQGFQYCDLLLTASERAVWQLICTGDLRPPRESVAHRATVEAVAQRAAKMFEWRLPSDSLLSIALDDLTLGRAALYAAILEGSDFRLLTSDLSYIDAAVDGLRRAGTQDHLPRGFLARACCSFAKASAHKLRGDAEEAARLFWRAHEDLDEAWEIAERGPMKLFMADIHLCRARLFGKRIADSGGGKEEMPYPWESPAVDLAAAEKLIHTCGYHRRDEELVDAKHAILDW
ncbi:MAG: hypothetical protein QOH01_156 [Verrucomicrobiota bacterium]